MGRPPRQITSPIFSAHLAQSSDQGVTFSDQVTLTFLSSATDNGNSQAASAGRLHADEGRGILASSELSRQMAFPLAGRSPTTIRSSSESVLSERGSGNHKDRLTGPSDSREQLDLYRYCNQQRTRCWRRRLP